MQYFYLHGFLSGPQSNKGKFLNLKFNQSGNNLISPDLNDGDFSRMTISSQMEVLKRKLMSNSEPAVLIGSSLGGYLAVLLAEQLPQIEKLVLIAPAFEFAERYLNSLSPQQLAEWQNNGFLPLYHYHYQKEMKLAYGIVEDGLKYNRSMIQREIETIMFHGINDASVPYELSIEYLKKNSRARLMLLNSDHGLLDHLEFMWTYIDVFLAVS
jgi:pimeloyl-ACP methyl ester carboxylesterase